MRDLPSTGNRREQTLTALKMAVEVRRHVASCWTFCFIIKVVSMNHQAAKLGAEATVDMKAKAGRASYVNVSQLTQKDPGAEAVALWMQAIFDNLKSP